MNLSSSEWNIQRFEWSVTGYIYLICGIGKQLSYLT